MSLHFPKCTYYESELCEGACDEYCSYECSQSRYPEVNRTQNSPGYDRPYPVGNRNVDFDESKSKNGCYRSCQCLA